jgi:hypothetical protein
VDLDELGPVGERATGGRNGRRFERFAEVCQDLPDRPRLRDEGYQPDFAAAVGALERKLLPHPGHEFGTGNPGGVVRAGLCMSVAAAIGGLSAGSVPDGECGDGRPQLVIRGKHPVVAMPVLPRRRDKIGEPVD